MDNPSLTPQTPPNQTHAIQQPTPKYIHDQALLQQILETSPISIAVVNTQGQITYANHNAEQVLGLTKQQITNLTYDAPAWQTTAIDGFPFPDSEQPFVRVMTTQQPVADIRHAIRWPNGKQVFLSINGAPLMNNAGEIEGAVFTITDITDQIHTEARRRQEMQIYNKLSGSLPAQITAESLSQQAFRTKYPAQFSTTVSQYLMLMDKALENRGYKTQYPVSETLQTIANTLGHLNAGPRDVVEIHITALQQKSITTTLTKLQACTDEGRLLLVELMGYLVTYYRMHLMGFNSRQAPFYQEAKEQL